MDFTIETDGISADMTFEKVEDIRNNVFLSLYIDKGSFFLNPEFGSRLYLLKRAKLTPNTEKLAIEYCKEALQWIINIGRATKFEYFTEIDKLQNPNRLKILIRGYQEEKEIISYEHFLEVV